MNLTPNTHDSNAIMQECDIYNRIMLFIISASLNQLPKPIHTRMPQVCATVHDRNVPVKPLKLISIELLMRG